MKIEEIAKKCKTIEIQQYFDGDDSEGYEPVTQGFLVKPNKGTLVSITRNFFDNTLEQVFSGFKRDPHFTYLTQKDGKDVREYILFKYFPKVLEHFKEEYKALEDKYKGDHNRADLTYEVILLGVKIKETFVMDSLMYGNLSIRDEKIQFINMLFNEVGKDELEKYLFMDFKAFKTEVLKINKFKNDNQVWRWLDLLENYMRVPAAMIEYAKELRDLLNYSDGHDLKLFKKIVNLGQKKQKIDNLGHIALFYGLVPLRSVHVLKNITLCGSCAEPMKYTMSDHYSAHSVNSIDEQDGVLNLKTFFPFLSHSSNTTDKQAKMEAYVRYTNVLFQELGIEEGEVSFSLIDEYRKTIPNEDPFLETEICDGLSNDSDVMAIISIPLSNYKSAMDWYFKHIFFRYWTRIVENQEFTYEAFLEWEKGNLKTKSGRPVLLTELLMLVHQWYFNDPTFCHTQISRIRTHRFAPTAIRDLTTKLAELMGDTKEGASYASSWKILNKVHPLNEYIDQLKRASELRKDYVGSMNEFCKSLNLANLLPSKTIQEHKIETSLTFLNDSEFMLALITELKEKLGKNFHRNSVPELTGDILEIVCKHVISD